MDHAKVFRNGFAATLLVFVSLISGSLAAAQAQESAKSQPAQSSSEPTKAKVVARESGRDPFKKYEAPRLVLKRSMQLTPPSIEERVAQYRAQKLAAMNAHVAAPRPTTALLLNELQVIGISRTPRGYAAIVEATPIRLSYVIYPGEKFYDGQLVAIEDTRLVFRHEIVWTDGRRDRSVEMKALRQPSAVDAMTAVKAAPASAPAGDAEKKSEDKASPVSNPK